jgi:uncharacterized protein (TIGR02147 family)
MGSDWRPDIFGFIDYRAYLKAYYEAGKANTRVISFRYLAKRAGFSSPSYLRHVMQGERSLGVESVEKLVEALALGEAEGRYFRDLVAFGQAEGAEARTVAFERVASHRRFRQARRIEGGLFRYLSRWYYPAIREMSALPDFEADAVKVAGRLLPPIKVQEAREALETLFELGLLVRGEDGRVVRAEPTLSTEHEVRNLGIGNYHRQMLERAAASIELCAREHRDLAAMTVCVSLETVTELKKRVHEFRERLLELCDSDPEPQVVFQINTQLFPLSSPVVDSKDD